MGMDTLKTAQSLEAAGMERKIAEAVAHVINEHGRADLVTKGDLESALWRQTVTIILANAVVVGFLLTLLRSFG